VATRTIACTDGVLLPSGEASSTRIFACTPRAAHQTKHWTPIHTQNPEVSTFDCIDDPNNGDSPTGKRPQHTGLPGFKGSSMQVFRKFTYALVAVSAAGLVACGGGNSSSGVLKVVTASAADTASVSGGQSLVVAGTATSARYALSTVTWQVQAITSGAPDLTLTNADCSTASKTNQTGTNDGGTSYTTSTWGCSVSVKAPQTSTDEQYQLLLTATDSNGSVDTHTTTLTVAANTTSSSSTALTADAGSALTLTSGNSGQLNCLASGGDLDSGSSYTYQWVQTSGADAAITLSDSTSQSPTFTAPSVSAVTTVVMQCRATDDSSTTATANKTIVIDPAAGAVLIADAGNASNVAPGESVTLNGSGTGWFQAGSQVTGTQLYYQWTQTSGPTVTLTNPNQVSTTFTVPTDITDVTQYSFQLLAQDTAIGTTPTNSSTANVNVTADPEGTLDLSLASASQSVTSNTAVLMTADVSSSVTSTVYYSWTQISGPTVSIGGSLTSEAGFVAPVVTEATTFVFRVTAGFKPISNGYAGVATQDEVVVVTPSS